MARDAEGFFLKYFGGDVPTKKSHYKKMDETRGTFVPEQRSEQPSLESRSFFLLVLGPKYTRKHNLWPYALLGHFFAGASAVSEHKLRTRRTKVWNCSSPSDSYWCGPITFTRMLEPRHNILSNHVRTNVRKYLVTWLELSHESNRRYPDHS